MALIPFRKFRKEDLEIIVPNLNDEEVRNRPAALWRAWGEYEEKYSVAYTGCIEGRPIVAAGIRIKNKDVGTAWAYFTNEAVEKHKLSVICSMKLLTQLVIEECGFKKIRAAARRDLPGACKLCELFGFKKIRKMIGGKHDYYVLRVTQ